MEEQNNSAALAPAVPAAETSPTAAPAPSASEPSTTTETDGTLNFGYQQTEVNQAIIKVVGVGGGGGNAVQHMYSDVMIQDVSYLVINTDEQALKHNSVPHKLAIAKLGAGAKPPVARAYAEKNADAIRTALNDGTQMVFITAGMGGGTGTGAGPVVARIARELGILTVGIVTIPFAFEGKRKIDMALDGVAEMRKHVDAMLVVNNDRLIKIFPDLKFRAAMAKADDTLAFAAKSISDIINIPGYINVDFADVTTTLKGSGVALISSGTAKGPNRVTRAIQEAINSPLLHDNDISQAKHLLFELCYSETHPAEMHEIGELNNFIEQLNPDIDVIWGAMEDNSLDEEVKIILLASGFELKGGDIVAPSALPVPPATDPDEDIHRTEAAQEARRKAEEEEARRKAETERREKIAAAQVRLDRLVEHNRQAVEMGFEPSPVPADIRAILGLDDEAVARIMHPGKAVEETALPEPDDDRQETLTEPAAAPAEPDETAPTEEETERPTETETQPDTPHVEQNPQGPNEHPQEQKEEEKNPHEIRAAASIDDGIERIRLYYGDEVANRRRMDQVRSKYFIFEDEDLTNEALIAELEKLPAYQRTQADLAAIQARRNAAATTASAPSTSPDGTSLFG